MSDTSKAPKFTHPDDAPEGHKWQTWDGREARFLGSADNIMQLAFVIEHSVGPYTEVIVTCTASGMHSINGPSSMDIIDTPQEYEAWMNVYANGNTTLHHTAAEADDFKVSSRVSRVRLTGKVE